MTVLTVRSPGGAAKSKNDNKENKNEEEGKQSFAHVPFFSSDLLLKAVSAYTSVVDDTCYWYRADTRLMWCLVVLRCDTTANHFLFRQTWRNADTNRAAALTETWTVWKLQNQN